MGEQTEAVVLRTKSLAAESRGGRRREEGGRGEGGGSRRNEGDRTQGAGLRHFLGLI